MAFYILPQKLKCHFNKRVVFFILLCCFVVCVGLVVKLGTDACKIKDFLGRKEALTKRGEILRTFSHPYGSGTE